MKTGEQTHDIHPRRSNGSADAMVQLSIAKSRAVTLRDMPPSLPPHEVPSSLNMKRVRAIRRRRRRRIQKTMMQMRASGCGVMLLAEKYRVSHSHGLCKTCYASWVRKRRHRVDISARGTESKLPKIDRNTSVGCFSKINLSLETLSHALQVLCSSWRAHQLGPSWTIVSPARRGSDIQGPMELMEPTSSRVDPPNSSTQIAQLHILPRPLRSDTSRSDTSARS